MQQPLLWLRPLLPGFSGWGHISEQAAHQIQSSPKLFPETERKILTVSGQPL